jgi:LacI family transcriptional regulator
VAEALNYKPTNKNKIPKTEKKFGLISLYAKGKEISDPYFLSIRMSIEKRCKERNIKIIKIYNNEDSDYRDKLKDLDGLILMGRFNEEEAKNFHEINRNLVFVDSSPEPNLYDSVISDLALATKKVVDYFVSEGHNKIGLLGARNWFGWEREQEYLIDERVQTFKEYTNFLGIYNEELIRVGEFDSASGYKMMKDILASPCIPTAVFASSDMMAIGAMKAINESGLHIPDDISIVGYDYIPMTDYLTPALSTTKVHSEFMGARSVDLLIEQIESEREIPIKIMVPTELIIKGS